MSDIPSEKHKKIHPVAVFKSALRLYKIYFREVLTVGFIVALINLLLNPLVTSKNNINLLIYYVCLYIYVPIIDSIFIWYLDKREHGHNLSLYSILTQPSVRFIPAIFIFLITIFSLAIGLVLFIIPGLIWGAMFSQAFSYTVLEKKGVGESLRLSKKLTNGNKLNILVVFALLVISFYTVTGIFYWLFGTQITTAHYVFSFIYSLFLGGFTILLTYAIWRRLKEIHSSKE